MRVLMRGRAGTLEGIEQSPELCRRTHARLGSNASIVRGDLQVGLPFPPASFDVVVKSEVVEHLASPVAALRNIATALRSGGTLVMAFPNAAAYPLWRFGERRFRHPLGYRLAFTDHPTKTFEPLDTLISPQDITRLLAEAGLRPLEWAGTRLVIPIRRKRHPNPHDLRTLG
jgi:SAM-dependent methyltransferase